MNRDTAISVLGQLVEAMDIMIIRDVPQEMPREDVLRCKTLILHSKRTKVVLVKSSDKTCLTCLLEVHSDSMKVA